MARKSSKTPAARNRRAAKASADPDAQTLGDFLAFDSARLLVAHDAWSGMSEDSPHAGVYELKRTSSGALVGHAWMFRRGQCEHAQELRLSEENATSLLRLIADSLVLRIPYKPLIEHTDDFPSIEIAIHVGPTVEAPHGGIALLSTSSQGESHVPWCACVRGEVFTLLGDNVGRALNLIRGLVEEDAPEAKIAAHAKMLVDAMVKKYEPGRKQGEAMSRKEAEDIGGEEFGAQLYRLANEAPSKGNKPSGRGKGVGNKS
jgi:hypothetical protein